jgi:hypothetical protein
MAVFYSPSKNGFYHSDIQDTMPSDILEITDLQYNTLLNGNHKEGKEIYFDGKAPALRLVETKITWDLIRGKRNRLIRKCDYTQMPDFPGDKVAWATYRQALRDLPQTYANVEDIIWPVAPGE